MPLKFIFVRHAEAKHNADFHIEGETAFSKEENRDAPLTEKGKKQAQATGITLSPLDILDIWSSPLTRCLETAEEIYEEVNCNELFLHDNLLERQGGNHICNMRQLKKEIKKKYSLWKTDYLPEFGPFWIERESTVSVQSRMLMFVQYLHFIYSKSLEMYKDMDKDRYILIISHNDAICCLTGKSLANAEHVILTFEEILRPPKV